MTQDYTQIGTSHGAASPRPLAPNQRIVLLAIRYSGVAFLGAGAWLSGGGDSPFPAESSGLIGYAFIAAGAMDILIAAFLRRQWMKGENPR